MQGIVDRIEENIIVIEVEKRIYNVSLNVAEGKINEGDVVDLIFENDKIVKVSKNINETKSREEYIKEITKDMWQ